MVTTMKILLSIILCGFLHAWGGAAGTSKAWRRVGIPIVRAVIFWNAWYLLIFIPLSLGYGEDSWLRKLFVSDEMTRFVVGIMYGVCKFVSITDTLVLGIITCLFGTMIHSEPQVEIFGKVLNTEEMIIGGVVGA